MALGGHARTHVYLRTQTAWLYQDWAVGRKKVRAKRSIFHIWSLLVCPHVMLQLDVLLDRLTVSI